MHAAGFWRRAGQRGIALVICAVLDITYGLSLLAGHTPAPTHAAVLLSLDVWGWIFTGTGIALATGVLLPSGKDKLHYALAVIIKCLWGALILSYWIEHRNQGGWGSAVPWLALASFLLLIAGWGE